MGPVVLCLLLSGCAAGEPLTVRVDPAGGAPRLMVNDKAVRGRMFYGGPSTKPFPLSAAGGWVEGEFNALFSEPDRAVMHFRFGATPGRVVVDDLQVTDLDTGRTVLATDFEDGPAAFDRRFDDWPLREQNTVATTSLVAGVGQAGSTGLVIDLREPPGGQWPDWHLYAVNLALEARHRYRVRFWAQADPERTVRVAFYRPGDSFVFLGGPGEQFDAQIRLAGAAEAPFVSFAIAMPWPRPGEQADFSAVDGTCETVLAANPEALLLPRFGLDAPAWWLQAHPDEAMVWDGEGTHAPHAVICSPLYQQEALGNLEALVRHLEERFPDRLAGYHPCGQNTGEWFYEDSWGPDLNGYAPADLVGYRRWLGDPDATVPTSAERRAMPDGLLRDPVAQRNVVQFADFQQQAMADWLVRMAATVKQACERRKLVVFFYGYVYEFAGIFSGAASAGHYALRKTLDCPDIDILCSPQSYFDRQVGGSGPCMTAGESVALANKLWLVEDDTRTYLVHDTGFPGDVDGGNTQEETRRLLQRNVGEEVARNFATWWMDLGSAGWYNDPVLWADMKALAPLDQAFLDQPTPFRPEVASVIDERSMLLLNHGGSVASRPVIYAARADLGRLGAPYGQYLQDDLEAGRVLAKLVVMHSAWQTDAAQRARLRAALAGKVRLWCWAPGFVDGQRPNPEAQAELTGFRLQRTGGGPSLAEPTAAGRAFGLTQPVGSQDFMKPLYAVVDAEPGEVLATYGDGSAAIALRQQADGWSLFVGPPDLTPDLLRAAARLAGVHLYAETDANIYANGPLVAVHAAADGPLDLQLRSAGPVSDWLTGVHVGDGPTLTLQLTKGETRLLRVK